MRLQEFTDLEREILRGGFAGSDNACLVFADLQDDTVIIMARHPDSDDIDPSRIVMLNSKLRDNECYQQQFKRVVKDLDYMITDGMDAAGLDTVSLAIAIFVTAVDMGHIDPYKSPLSDAVKMSQLNQDSWAVDMIACRVFHDFVDGKERRRCGSQQRPEDMPKHKGHC